MKNKAKYEYNIHGFVDLITSFVCIALMLDAIKGHLPRMDASRASSFLVIFCAILAIGQVGSILYFLIRMLRGDEKYWLVKKSEEKDKNDKS